VFKWRLNTKDSEPAAEWQGVFAPPEGLVKRGTKTAGCGVSNGLSPFFPPPIHRIVHKRAGRRTVPATLQFCDSESVPQRNMPPMKTSTSAQRGSA
jgi:hypothetical protein